MARLGVTGVVNELKCLRSTCGQSKVLVRPTTFVPSPLPYRGGPELLEGYTTSSFRVLPGSPVVRDSRRCRKPCRGTLVTTTPSVPLWGFSPLRFDPEFPSNSQQVLLSSLMPGFDSSTVLEREPSRHTGNLHETHKAFL